jgi:hypothetical protein
MASKKRSLLVANLVVAGTLFLGKAPLSQICVFQAEHLLTTGNYHGVLSWLDTAYWLNPALDQLPSYHLERGQAWYYLDNQHLNLDGMAYLAAYYRTQNDFLSSSQLLQSAWNTYPHTLWLKNEMALSLSALTEMSKPLKGNPLTRINADAPSLRWLEQLIKIDPDNFYAQYTAGRIYCELGEYSMCEASMQTVLQLNTTAEVQSSADTYIAVSMFSSGNPTTAREYLYAAQRSDIEYRNNIARELLSGMR